MSSPPNVRTTRLDGTTTVLISLGGARVVKVTMPRDTTAEECCTVQGVIAYEWQVDHVASGGCAGCPTTPESGISDDRKLVN